jgi:DNA mismatch repair protein MSH2
MTQSRQGSQSQPTGVLAQIDPKAFVSYFNSLRSDSSLGQSGGTGGGGYEGGENDSGHGSDGVTIRFFDRKTCISVHGDPGAFVVAKALYKSTAQVVDLTSGTSILPSMTLTYNLFPVALRELLVSAEQDAAKYRVEYYVENEGATSSKKESWVLKSASSPGRIDSFMEDELCKVGTLEEHPIVVAVSVGYDASNQRTVGLAYIDVHEHGLGACEFVDDGHFCSLEMALMQLGPKEAVVSAEYVSGDGAASRSKKDARTLLALLEDSCGILTSKKLKSSFKTKNLEHDLARLLKGNQNSVESLARPILDACPQASSALAAVIDFAQVMPDASNHSRYTLTQYNMGKYMRLDAAAQKALNVLKSKTDANDSFSLYGLMDRCGTPMGRRLLKTYLKQPLTGLDEINERLDVVEALVCDPASRQDLLQVHFRGLPDVHRLSRKLDKSSATLKDLCDLHRVSTRLPEFERVLRDCCESGGPKVKAILEAKFLDELAVAHDASHLGKFEELIEAAIDFERIPEEYLISYRYDAELGEIERNKVAIEEEIAEAAAAAANDLGLELGKTIKLEWLKVSNQKTRCLRITQKEEKNVRGKIQAKYIELETRKDGIKFTNKRLRSAAEELQRLSGEYDRKQAKLVSQVVEVAATFSHVWEKVAGVLAELDVLNGFAVLSTSAPTQYIRPTLRSSTDDDMKESIILKGSRHPCVEAQDSVSFIPNDVSLVKGESWFQLITGPNMGGKSTFIRQVGMCVLMAQVGCFVPCDEAIISLRDAIFARVGAGDCQLRGVSTFMAEMLETASILKGATNKSLVIIDELGRGTSTWDGMGLAWAISEHLMEHIGAPTLFATHFHELTALNGSVGVKNLHVKSTIDPNRGGLTMLYQVHEGSCDQSLGIHVAEFARFPRKVIDDAKAKALELDGTMVIDIVKATRREPEDDDKDADRKRDRADQGSDEDIRRVLLEFAQVDFQEGGDEDRPNGQLIEAWRAKLSAMVPGDAGHRKNLRT